MEDVNNIIANAAPDKIVYISCNPPLNRVIYSFFSDNYFVVRVQPVDMFPHTFMLKNVVLLNRRDSQKVQNL